MMFTKLYEAFYAFKWMMQEIADKNIFKIMTLLNSLALVAPNGTEHVVHCMPQTNIYSFRVVIIHLPEFI